MLIRGDNQIYKKLADVGVCCSRCRHNVYGQVDRDPCATSVFAEAYLSVWQREVEFPWSIFPRAFSEVQQRIWYWGHQTF